MMASDADARAALYGAVVKAIADSENMGPHPRAKVLIAAAVAFRAAQGGPQVGNITFEE